MANRDKNENIGFLYTNIHQLYKEIQKTQNNESLSSKKVFKAEDIANSNLKVTKFKPQAFEQNRALDSLKENVNKLQDLHSRLRFMLRELDTLVKRKK
ncbi:MAG: hypothetical protein AB7F43_07330 [Bacteriovoracia bacterium]